MLFLQILVGKYKYDGPYLYFPPSSNACLCSSLKGMGAGEITSTLDLSSLCLRMTGAVQVGRVIKGIG